jgi:hypothetical protein
VATYNDKLDPDVQITMEEGIAGMLFSGARWSLMTEELAQAMSRHILLEVLRQFRPDLVDE